MMPSCRRHPWPWTSAAALAALAILVAVPANPVGYLARAALGQADMLWGRVSYEDALAAGTLSAGQRARLELVPQIKRWGQQIGLSSTDNYDTLHPTWDRTIWNVSGCAQLSFEPKRYWFPIVGSLTYIGYFDEPSARAQADRLASQGYDTYVRTAGAYSTLGWFRDPLLPHMLDWSEDRLSDTLIHELAHATLWVPGHADFNESFANFVGERGALQWLIHHHGPGSDEVARARRADEDNARYQALVHGVVDQLEALYADQALPDQAKHEQKAQILASLPARAASAGFHDAQRYQRLFSEPWNNARLLQFRTYNRGQHAFEVVLGRQDGSLIGFIDRIRELTADGSDPWEALSEASGVSVDRN